MRALLSRVLLLVRVAELVENTSDEFALYLVHETGERTKLSDTEYPLISRILHGPCEKIAKIFLMETDLGEEVTYDVENTSDEFALYLVHETGERTKLSDTEYPLISRILHGPCEKIAKIFLMETDLGEEVTYDVAQYIKFEMPLLDSFVEKLKEEEEREIIKLTRK
ncbi:UNVERIFIED_CONTAM: hypothetical protein FKN15_075002 [Acipenser sinensis]